MGELSKIDLDQMIKDAEADENHSRQATQPEPALDPALRNINITICQSCLDGKGEECHTPGCALYLHRVDLPIAPELYTILPDSPTDEQIFEDLALCEAATPEPWDNVGIRHYATGETRLSLSERLNCTVMASQADYDFIARARTALPAYIRAYQAERAKVREIIDAAEEAGWNGVDNSKFLTGFISDLAERAERAEADNAKLKADLNEAACLLSKYARAAGLAEGKLKASERAGMVEMWQEQCDKLKATIQRICRAFQGDDPEPPTVDELIGLAPDFLHALSKLGGLMELEESEAKLRAALKAAVEALQAAT